MPIYAYKCESCGHAKDVLQKMADDPLTQCPACSGATFKKQLTAAGFQLKGSGWYVTDFRNGNTAGGKPATPDADAGASDAAAGNAPTAAPDAGTASAPSNTPANAPAAAPASSAAPAPTAPTVASPAAGS